MELPCPSPGDFPDPGMEHMSLMSPALAFRFFTTGIIWEAQLVTARPQILGCSIPRPLLFSGCYTVLATLFHVFHLFISRFLSKSGSRLESQEKNRTTREPIKVEKELIPSYSPPSIPQEWQRARLLASQWGPTPGNTFLVWGIQIQFRQRMMCTLLSPFFVGDKLCRNVAKIQRGNFAFLFFFHLFILVGG